MCPYPSGQRQQHTLVLPWFSIDIDLSDKRDEHAKMLKNVQICSILWVFGGFRGCRISKK